MSRSGAAAAGKAFDASQLSAAHYFCGSGGAIPYSRHNNFVFGQFCV